MPAKSTTTVWTGVRTLADLREIVNETAAWGSESVVTLSEAKSHSPVDHDPPSVTVTRRNR